MDERITPTFIHTEEKRLVGLKQTMSLTHNLTGELWKLFMQQYPISTNRISLQVYPSNYFENFSPNASFEKWALVEAIDLETIPPSFKQFILPSGLYAVFHYKGLNTDSSIFQYIYSEWLPSSGYILDNRPHFEVLGNLYRNNHPESEEDIWIPIKPMN